MEQKVSHDLSLISALHSTNSCFKTKLFWQIVKIIIANLQSNSDYFSILSARNIMGCPWWHFKRSQWDTSVCCQPWNLWIALANFVGFPQTFWCIHVWVIICFIPHLSFISFLIRKYYFLLYLGRRNFLSLKDNCFVCEKYKTI
jgi:hypothetical protein